MFAYCNNNPANAVDSSGRLPIRNTMLMVSDSGLNIQGRSKSETRKADELPDDVRYFMSPAVITTFQASKLNARVGRTYSASHGELGSDDGVSITMDTLSVSGGLNLGNKGVYADVGAYLINDSISIPFLFGTRIELEVHVGYGFTIKANENGFKIGTSNMAGVSVGLVWSEEPSNVQYTRAQSK